MFRRLILENWHVIFTIFAFSVAASVHLTLSWRALRMKREQTEKLAQLPFQD